MCDEEGGNLDGCLEEEEEEEEVEREALGWPDFPFKP